MSANARLVLTRDAWRLAISTGSSVNGNLSATLTTWDNAR